MKYNDKEYLKAFGEFVQAERLKQGLFQAEVAEKLGISQSHLSYIESGEREISLNLSRKICEALNTDLLTFISKHN